MADMATMSYGVAILDSYLVVINMLRALSNIEKEIIPNYVEITGETLQSLEQVKEAFTGRKFLREYLDYEISDERIEEFEDFLEGRRNELSGLDEDIKKLDNLYNSLKFLN